MIALWWFLSLTVACLVGFIGGLAIGRAHRESRSLALAFSYPLSQEEKKQLVAQVMASPARLSGDATGGVR